MNYLLQRPKPYRDENLSSYIIRLAEANGYKDDKSIYRLIGINTIGGSPRNIYKLEEAKVELYFEQLSRLTKNSIDSIYKITFLHEFVQLRNSIVTKTADSTGLFYYANIQVCPICLNENPYYRKVWDIKYYTCCHIHKCLMITKCPTCSAQLKPNGYCIYKCKCGEDLRNLKTKMLYEHELAIAKKLNLIVTSTSKN